MEFDLKEGLKLRIDHFLAYDVYEYWCQWRNVLWHSHSNVDDEKLLGMHKRMVTMQNIFMSDESIIALRDTKSVHKSMEVLIKHE